MSTVINIPNWHRDYRLSYIPNWHRDYRLSYIPNWHRDYRLSSWVRVIP